MKHLTKLSFLLFTLLLIGSRAFAQNTIFFEKMGTTTATVSIAAHEAANGFDNDQLTMTSGGITPPADIRRTSSRGTDGADDANVFFTGSGTLGFAIEDIDASAYTDLKLSFFYRKESGTALPTLSLEYWNGTAYVAVPFTFAEAANAAVNWYAVNNISLPAAAERSDLKLRWVKSGTASVRLDEVKLEGTQNQNVAPTIASTLHNRANVLTTVQETFSVSTTPGSYANQLVKVKMTLANPAQRNDFALEYLETAVTPNQWLPLTFDANGEMLFGPAAGFPLAAATSQFRVTYSAAGTYNYSLAIVDAATGAELAPATAESVTVGAFVVPAISSTLNNRANVLVNAQETFSVTTTAGSMAGEMVHVKLALATPAQRSNITLEYFETASSTWQPLTFDANGELLFGPATGFPLADATTNFRITFNAAGTYNYSLAVVDAATGTALAPATAESVTVTSVVSPTIASTLNNRAGVIATIQETFSVTTTAGSMAGEMVKVKLALATPAQRNNITLEYFETASSTWQPLTFDANGELLFGPATGFPLANATTDFRISFDAAGTYNYSLSVVNASTGAALAPATSESVTVGAFVSPTISSNLNNRSGVIATVQENFTVTTTAGSLAGNAVKVKIALATPAQRNDITLEYFETSTSTWLPLTFDAAGELLFGPAAGFPLANATTDFRITFDAAGTYNYSLAVVDAATGTALVPATAESVTVAAFVAPTIASTLNNRAGVVATIQETFTVSATAGSMAGELVHVKLTLATPAQRNDITLEYFETTTSTWLPLTFDASGELLFGPAAGFPLADADTDFRITFNTAGTYNYSLAIVDAATGAALVPATAESVTVGAFVAPVISSNLNNRSGILVNQTETFTITTVAGSLQGEAALIRIELDQPNQANDITLEYSDGAAWQQLTFDAAGVAIFGPAAGFPLDDETIDFRVTFAAAGQYGYSLSLVDAADSTTTFGSASAESVNVGVVGVKEDVLSAAISVYPNPASGMVTVKGFEKASITVIDLTGRQVASVANAYGDAMLDVSALAAGTYIIRIQQGNQLVTKKLNVVR